jgi:5,10-methenyltetrahydrofolate synthetase
MAHEVNPTYFDPLGVDPAQMQDVARWRKAKRAELRAARQALSVAARATVGAAISAHLGDVITDRLASAGGRVVSGYWPIKGEPDLRGVMTELHAKGIIVALPIVETKAAPLIFRRWTPGMAMVRGDWDIPVPPLDAVEVSPDITLAPCMGWDDGCYRLGYGGGYFDRTLAALTPPPFNIGIEFQSARLATIYPQPHDIALDIIVTEAGVQAIRDTP